MGTPGVVVASPLLNDDLRLSQAVEDFPVEAFISELAVEAFVVAILPRTAGVDEQRLWTDLAQPISH